MQSNDAFNYIFLLSAAFVCLIFLKQIDYHKDFYKHFFFNL